jgi:multidrug resistance efflux pump
MHMPFASLLRRRIRATLTAVLVAVCAGLCTWAYRFYEYTPWTRDGRIRVYVVDSAPEVGGLVVEVPVADNQFVHKGDVLYRIDSRDYQSALQSAEAAADGAKQTLNLQEENVKRREQLQTGDVSEEERRTYAITALVQEANLRGTEAALFKARNDLDRCQVRSAVNGWVTNLSVRAGNFATTGQRQMSVVDADSFYIYAYFEETQLRNIRVNANARAILMGYPGTPLFARVESIGRGITDTDASPDSQGLPQVNPIFTWVRLAQRIPVRLHIDDVPNQVQLAAGETCTVCVDPP